MKRTFLKVGLFALSTTFMVACSSDTTSSLEDHQNPLDDKQTETSAIEEDEPYEMNYMLPSPIQIAEILASSGLEYNESFPNPISHLEKYTTSNSQLLNFGTYSADLSYCVINNESQSALNYMRSVEKLSERLGLSSIFATEDLIETFENNLSDPDSLVTVLSKIQERLDEYVDDNEEHYMHLVIFGGAWVESMYLGSKTLNNSNKGRVARKLVEQMSILDNIIAGLSNHPKSDQQIKELTHELVLLKDIYEGFAAVSNLGEDEEPDYDTIEITDEEFSMLAQKVEVIRASIVQG